MTMAKKDPISQGHEIFMDIFRNYQEDVITDIDVAESFIKEIITESEGWIITDFLDSGCWDNLGSIMVNHEDDTLFLNWHIFRNQPSLDEFVSHIGYRPSIQSVMLHFKELTIFRHNKFPCFTVRGYAQKDKEIVSRLKKIGKNIKKQEWTSPNFYVNYELEMENCDISCHCYNTPIQSILVIPKNSFSSQVSVELLYHFNFNEAKNRLIKVSRKSNSTKGDDEIMGMANTVRSIFESVMKIECCFSHELKWKTYDSETPFKEVIFSKDYSDLMLGELTKLLAPNKSEEEMTRIRTIIRLSNELSHDTGKPITAKKLSDLTKLTRDYLDELIQHI